jgi:hypothetical protein
MAACLILLAVNIILWQMDIAWASRIADFFTVISSAPYALCLHFGKLEPIDDQVIEYAFNLALWGGAGALGGMLFELIRGFIGPGEYGSV